MTTATLPHGATLEVRPVATISPSPTNPRKVYDPEALKTLAASIKAKGVEQPLVCRHRGDGQLELVHGERRWRAARLAGLETVPVVIRQLTDAQVEEAQLAEMGQARDVSPLEKAQAFRHYMGRERLTQTQLAGRVGLSEPAVSEVLALLELPEVAREMFHDPRMTASHGRELLRLKEQPALLKRLAHDVRSALKDDGVYSAKRLRSEVARELAHVANLARWKAEEAERDAKAKAAAAAAKAGTGAKLTPAEVKAKVARRLALRVARQLHLELVARAPAIAKAVVAQGRRWKLPPELLVKVAGELTLGSTLRYNRGAGRPTWDTVERLANAVVPKLPGRWRQGPYTPSQFGDRPPLDATAARNWCGLWSWLIVGVHGLEASLTTGARRRLVQLAKAKAKPAPKGVKRGK